MNKNINYNARILAANAMGASIQFLTQRSYLETLSHNEDLMEHLSARPVVDSGCIQWIKITQIGRQVSATMHQYFTTMQKILFSCHDPHYKQLLFLIYGNGQSIELYLGVRTLHKHKNTGVAKQLSSFIKSAWQGVNANSIKTEKEKPTNFLKDYDLENVYTLTGIPSFVRKEGEECLTSIDTLLGTLSNQKFAYLVVADPIDENKIRTIINQCNEMAGQLESVKSFNFTDGINSSTSVTESKTTSHSETNTTSESKSEKSKLGLAIAGTALAVALGIPPTVTSKIASFIPEGIKKFASGNAGTLMFLLSGLIPQESKSTSNATTDSTSYGTSLGYTEGQSQSLSATIVNRHVEYVVKHLNAQLERFEEGVGCGMWNTGVYLLTSNDDIAQSSTLQLKAVVSGKNSHIEPIRVQNVTPLYCQNDGNNNYKKALDNFFMPNVPITLQGDSNQNYVIHNPFEGGESCLSTMLTTEELSCFINFPQHSVPGISVIDSSPDFSLRPQPHNASDCISIGNLLYSLSETNIGITIPTSTLTRHTLVTGVNGSGKTNTILNILQETAQQGVPFMVIEPAKTEYVEWAISFNKQLEKEQSEGRQKDEKPILIFMPGKTTYKWRNHSDDVENISLNQLRLNPFEVIGEGTSNVLAHLDRIKATFGAAFPMYDILPVIMETLLFHIYQDCLEDSTNRRYPTMSLLKACLEGVINTLGYDPRNRDNIKAAMTVRINSLLNGWKKELFDNFSLKDIAWDELFNGRCVINLSAMGDDTDRSFVMSLLLQFLYEYRINESESDDFSFNSNKLRHLAVIEEAHRVMSYNPNPDSAQAKCGQLFSNMLSEIRAYGQGLVIVDQVPERLIPDAIKNTNLKIIHRLIASDDIDSVASSMGLTSDQRSIIPRLATGQAIVSGVNAGTASYMSDSDVYWCKIHCKK